MTNKPSIESLLFKHIKDGPAGYVIRMRETHGAWVKDGVLRGCRCGEVFCIAYLWLAHIDNLKATIDQIRGQFQGETSANASLRAENEALRKDLERERIRLAACGVLAQSNTPGSLAYNREMEAAYWSASADDVCRAVEREMAERARAEEAEARVEALEEENSRLLAANKDNVAWFEDARAEAAKQTQRADAMAARVEALRSSLAQADMVIHKTVFPMFERRMGSSISECQACEVLASTPAADLSAHDAKIREPLEKRIAELEGERDWMRSLSEASPFPEPTIDEHDARVRREALEGAWERLDSLDKWSKVIVKRAVFGLVPSAPGLLKGGE